MKLFFYIIGLIASHSLWAAPIQTQQLHGFLWANYLQYKGCIAEADRWYQQIFEYSMPLYAHIGYIPFLFETKQFDKIVSLIPLLESQLAGDSLVQHIVALSLEKTGAKQAAMDKFIALSKKFNTHQEIIFHTMQLLIAQQKLPQALELINSYLNSTSAKTNNFIFYFIKAQLYLQSNQIAAAYDSIKKCIELYPHFDKGLLLYAILEEQQGNTQHAIEGYLSFLEHTQIANPQIEKHLIELAIKQTMANKQQSKITIDRACFQKVLLLIEQKQYRNAVKMITRCLQESNPAVHEKSMDIHIKSPSDLSNSFRKMHRTILCNLWRQTRCNAL
jgi:tetratricopeptide (TPR) repeat protein